MASYRTISDFFKDTLGKKVQKIAVSAGLGCPNRDGTIGTGGCIYCSNASFAPSYTASGSIAEQIGKGMEFFKRKTSKDTAYLAYFQSFTNTYGNSDRLIALYEEALACPGIEGLVIATRPDCLKADLLDWFAGRFARLDGGGPRRPSLLVELGVESTEDATLEAIGRGHGFACARDAITSLASRGIPVGAHIILGLPGEGAEEFDAHAARLSALPVSTIKLHQLQIIKGTALAAKYRKDPHCVDLFTADSYARAAARFISLTRPDIAFDRLVSEVPKDMLIAPCWGLKPDAVAALVEGYLTGNSVMRSVVQP